MAATPQRLTDLRENLLVAGERIRDNAKVHHLVLEAFVGPRPDGAHGCHANDIPDDNRLENLRWDTSEANYKDKVRNGRNRISHCKRGHELTGENVMPLKDGGRRCRVCVQIHNRSRVA